VKWSLCLSAAILGVALSCSIVPMEQAPDPNPSPEPNAVAVRVIPCKHEPVGDVFKWEPELLSMTDPQYPEAARKAGSEGTVICHVYIDTAGLVTQAHVSVSVTAPLDEAALQSARTAKFRPAIRADKSAAATWMNLPVQFKLH